MPLGWSLWIRSIIGIHYWCMYIVYLYIYMYDIYIWYDMIWCDMIWYDMIWCDMIWYDICLYVMDNINIHIHIIHVCTSTILWADLNGLYFQLAPWRHRPPDAQFIAANLPVKIVGSSDVNWNAILLLQLQDVAISMRIDSPRKVAIEKSGKWW
jgi:hypothetical protein